MLQPTNPLVMWAFTDLSDPRWTFTKKYMMLQQDPKRSDPQKLGHFNPKTWAGYFLGKMFLKRYDADPSRTYPDFGCSYETFTNDDFLEIETTWADDETAGRRVVGTRRALVALQEHPKPAWTDAELDRILLPVLSRNTI